MFKIYNSNCYILKFGLWFWLQHLYFFRQFRFDIIMIITIFRNYNTLHYIQKHKLCLLKKIWIHNFCFILAATSFLHYESGGDIFDRTSGITLMSFFSTSWMISISALVFFWASGFKVFLFYYDFYYNYYFIFWLKNVGKIDIA